MDIDKILKRKVFKDVLGDNYILSPKQKIEMEKFIKTKYAKDNNSFLRVRFFILYDLDNYVNRYEKNLSLGKGVTLEKLILCYGDEEANKRWNNYKEKQSETNTFSYKKEKYGWTKNDFNEYNKSRSIILENLITRHGEEIGLDKWSDYCEKQKYTNSIEYFIKKHKSKELGTEEWLKYNYSKGSSRRIDDIMNKHNFTREEACEYVSSLQSPANISNSEKTFVNLLFSKLGYDLKYSYKTKQFCLWCEKLHCPVFYDTCDIEKNIIIEYNGDMWHANPKKYKSDDIIPIVNKKAKDIWNYDFEKISTALSRNFRILKVWESDFINDPEKEIEKVIEWINK